jgi:acyl carrier protein
MKKSKFLNLLEELLEKDQGTLNQGDSLKTISSWDSLAAIGFIALGDQHFGRNVAASSVAKCQTINDLILLLGEDIFES